MNSVRHQPPPGSGGNAHMPACGEYRTALPECPRVTQGVPGQILRRFHLLLFRGTLLLLALVHAATGLPAQTIAFQRGGNVYVTDGDGTHARPASRGDDPALSPDGTMIAFTDTAGGKRRIALVDLATKRTRVLARDFGDNNYGPAWAHDGKTVLFNHFVAGRDGGGARWKIGMVGVDGTGARLLRDDGAADEFSPSGADGLVLFHDMQNLYLARPDGAVVETVPLARLGAAEGISSATRFSLSPDGRRILFDVMDVRQAPVNGEPPTAVFVHDREKGATVRVSPEGVCAAHPCWMSDAGILFEGSGAAGDVFVVNPDGTGPVKLLRNARCPSVSRYP